MRHERTGQPGAASGPCAPGCRPARPGYACPDCKGAGMTISLIDTVQDALTSGGIVNGAASTLGIPPAAAAKGLGGAGSTMLAALANRATDPLALGEFFNLVQAPALAGPSLDDPSRLLSGAAEGTRAGELGHQLTTSLFGGRTDEFTAALARHAAIDESAARSLIGMAAPCCCAPSAASCAAAGSPSPRSARR